MTVVNYNAINKALRMVWTTTNGGVFLDQATTD